MDISAILFAVLIILAAAAVCIIIFDRLGFGAILGFIVAGVLIGPHTPGPAPIHAVEELQSVAELGVVMFMFTVGLEMRPEKVWSMRRLIFGLGSAQMLVTAGLLAGYLIYFVHLPWETATILGLGLAMSSTAIVIATLGQRGELAAEHGKTIFAVLMAQDIWIVPIMALIPILAHQTAQSGALPAWETFMMIVLVIGGIFVIGRYLLPAGLGYCARHHQMDAFGVVLLLAVVSAAIAVEHVGISMTLGAFLLGMLLSASDFRYQIETTIAPYKNTLMALFFIAVGMSIDVESLLSEWGALLVHVPVVVIIKGAVLICLVLAFGVGRAAAVRAGFFLSQVGEFAFVLFGAAAVAGLLSNEGHTLAMLVVAVSMILTPLLVNAGDRIASRVGDKPVSRESESALELDGHVVIIGYNEVGQLIDLMLDKAKIPHIAVDQDINIVRRNKKPGGNIYFGDIHSSTTQEIAGLNRAEAVYIALSDMESAKALALTLHSLYPHLEVYVRVRTLADQDELVSKGIEHAVSGYIESTLDHGSTLLKGLGVPEDDVENLLSGLQQNDYELIRSGYAQT